MRLFCSIILILFSAVDRLGDKLSMGTSSIVMKKGIVFLIAPLQSVV
jgi:hypothetical protein